jgi:hypothetical protein
MSNEKFTKAHVNKILDHFADFENAKIGGLHYTLIESTNNKTTAKQLVKKLHDMGFGARMSPFKGMATGYTYYWVYARRQ